MTTAKDNAIALYMEGIRDGHPREAVAAYTGARYTQHSTGVADGQDGFIAVFEPFLPRNPKRDIKVIRAFQDGRHVFVQAHQSLNNGEATWITTDFFDSDDAGKIVEHWDVIDTDHGINLSGRSQIDGVTDVTDQDRTETNKSVVRDFFQDILLDRNLTKAADYLAADLAQHAPDMQDGRAAFEQFYGSSDCPLSYQECFLMVGEGNFVATLNRARWNEQDLCRVDLFRLESRLIVEHWVNSEPVPPKEQWANSGKF
ncbi:MAG: nuclear transport factor 2 family protein [Pseudomonadota bacterium]